MNDFAAEYTERQKGHLPAHLDFAWITLESGLARGHFDVQRHHMAPNGFLHAGTVVAFADTACGYGCAVSRPEGSTGFTTIELKTNLMGTAREGRVEVEARLVHGGRMTQVWDAEVTSAGRTIALFRCTQMVLWPR